jgi:hypothetical protein
MAKKKSPWSLIPSRDPDDQLYNRRLISYFSLFFSAVWFQQVFVLVVLGMFVSQPVTAPVITALLGVPASLAGLGFYKYLEACKKEDNKN